MSARTDHIAQIRKTLEGPQPESLRLKLQEILAKFESQTDAEYDADSFLEYERKMKDLGDYGRPSRW